MAVVQENGGKKDSFVIQVLIDRQKYEVPEPS